MSSLPPALILILGGFLIPFIKRPLLLPLVFALPILSFINLWHLPSGEFFEFTFLQMDLTLARNDKLSFLFGGLFHLLLFVGLIFNSHSKNSLEHAAAVMYAGAVMGVVFAGDLLSLFFHWELLSLAAMPLIFLCEFRDGKQAAFRYFLYHFAGGLLLLAGIILRYFDEATLAFGPMDLSSLGNILIFIGFGINAGWILFHTWIVDAYPKSTIGGIVFLSAFTTKAAVYALIRGFPGISVLIWIGAVMTIFPIFFAVIENDLRKVLSYSMINQVGFMIVGIGLGTSLSLNGAAAHAVAHVIYKSLLFMSIGAVIYKTGKYRATDLGGLYKSMPLTCIFCLIGAFSISAFPFFSGFVSKSAIVATASEHHLQVLWLILMFASAGVLEHAGIKIPYFTFYGHDSGIRVKEAPFHMLLAMGILALLCILIGVFPEYLYACLPFDMEYEPYTAHHVLTQVQLLSFACLAFFVLMISGVYPEEKRSLNLDIDYFYRLIISGLAKIVKMFLGILAFVNIGFAFSIANLSKMLFGEETLESLVFESSIDTSSSAIKFSSLMVGLCLILVAALILVVALII